MLFSSLGVFCNVFHLFRSIFIASFFFFFGATYCTWNILLNLLYLHTIFFFLDILDGFYTILVLFNPLLVLVALICIFFLF